MFNVKVHSVNLANVKGKTKSFRQPSRQPPWLAQGVRALARRPDDRRDGETLSRFAGALGTHKDWE
jgi:Ribosomal protein L23